MNLFRHFKKAVAIGSMAGGAGLFTNGVVHQRGDLKNAYNENAACYVATEHGGTCKDTAPQSIFQVESNNGKEMTGVVLATLGLTLL